MPANRNLLRGPALGARLRGRRCPGCLAAALAFLDSTYTAGATLAGWDRVAIERR